MLILYVIEIVTLLVVLLLFYILGWVHFHKSAKQTLNDVNKH